MEKGILTVVHYAADVWEHVCPIVRVVAPLERAGLRHVRGNEWEAEKLHIFPERIADADLVIIQRDFPRHAAEYESVIAQARALGKPVVYELDDLLTELPAEHPDVEFYSQARAATLQAAVAADAVTGSTPLLCDYLREFNPSVWLLPNYLVDQLWSLDAPVPFSAPGIRPVTIGYLGGHTHSFDLEMIVTVLERVLERYGERVVLKFWGLTPPAPLVEHQHVTWSIPGLVSYSEFAAYFAKQECDIFIAPMQDNLFNRCKSPLKFLEYSARGIPGVYSRIEPYANIVEHGRNGFLAGTPEEWEEYLSRLVESPDLRRGLGLAAQRTVRERWLLSSNAGRWAERYRQILGAARPSETNVATRVAGKMHTWHNELAQKNASLGAQLTVKEQTLRILKEELAEKEQAIQALSAQLMEKEQAVRSLRTELVAIKTSTAWGLLQMLWRLRIWSAPRGSWRERVLSLGMRGLRLWVREGFVVLARKATRKGMGKSLWRQGLPPGGSAQPQVTLTFKTENGSRCPTPAISVVVAKEGAKPTLDEQVVAKWVAAQVCQSVELVVWDRASGSALIAGESKLVWEARDVQSLSAGMHGRYVCVASPDLLQQNEMYLEANLIALETESLAFTVNVHGNADWVVGRIEAGQLLGNSTYPLLRQVVRKDCLGNNYAIDLSAWLAVQTKTPIVIGKLIMHTRDRADVEDSLPCETQFNRANILVLDRRIMTWPDHVASWEATVHVLHPVDSVLAISPVLSPVPTVLVVMPFLAVGGAERAHLDVMQRLKDQFRFVIITLEPYDASLGTTADAFREVTPYLYTVPDYLAMPLYLSIMTYLIERFQPRTLYIANGATWIYDALCTLKSSFPDLHMVNQVYDHQAGWINRYELSVATSLDAHIAVNRKICDAYVARGADPRHVYQIVNGVDEVEFDPTRYSEMQRRQIVDKLGLPAGRKVITFIGRLHQQKRPMDFVELARRFSSDSSMVFLMVGDGPLNSVVEGETTRIGLKNLVRHAFYRPSSDIFAISDVVVIPSEYEGMPMVILEAQAMGRPVVATDVGNNREVLELTRGGIIVPRIGDVTALSETLRQVLRAPIDPAQIRAATLTHFALPKMVEAYRRILSGELDA